MNWTIGYASDHDPRTAEFLCVRHWHGALPETREAYPFAVRESQEYLAGSCPDCE